MANEQNPISLCDEKILEFDVDIDKFGNIGVIILSDNGQLCYYFFNGNTWSKSLLYQLDFNAEKMKDISIRFSNNSPYILCCWKNTESSNLWSIISYYSHNDCWKNEVITDIRFLYEEDIKPYILIRDLHFNLYLIYLTNSNIIYDLNMKILSHQSFQWGNPLFLSHCIYLKYFHLDALIDQDKGVHISWIDKTKDRHCINYLYKSKSKYKSPTPMTILESIDSFIGNQLFMENHSIICYGMTNEYIYYTTQLLQSTTIADKWNPYKELDVTPNSINKFKTVYHPSNPLIHYHANCILTTDSSLFLPIHYGNDSFSKNSSTSSTTTSNTDNYFRHAAKKIGDTQNSNDNIVEIHALKRLYAELLEKKQALDAKENLLKILESQISLLNEEINKLSIDDGKIAEKNSPLDDMKNNLQELSSECRETMKNNLDDQLQNLIKTVEDIQMNYSSINQSLAHINQKQKENKEKIEDLLYQYSTFSEYLKKINNNPLVKLLNFFK